MNETINTREVCTFITVSEQCYQDVPWDYLYPVLEQNALDELSKLGTVVSGMTYRVECTRGDEGVRAVHGLPETEAEFYVVSFTAQVIPHEPASQ